MIQERETEARVYNHVLADISRARPLTGEGYRVFLYLLGNIKSDNTIPSPSETAKALEMERANVSRAYQVMLRDGYLIKKGDDYAIHPFIAYRGSGRDNAISKALIGSHSCYV